MAKKKGVPLANAALRHTLAARDRANEFSGKDGLISPTLAVRQIPLSPPHHRTVKAVLFCWRERRKEPSLMPLCGIRSLHAIGRTSFRKRRLFSPTLAERQIPLSPPHHRTVKAVLFCWRESRKEPSLMPPCGIRSLHAIGRTSFRKRRLFSPTIAVRQIPLSPPHHRTVKAVLFCWRERRKEPSLIINISAAVKL